MRILYLSLFVFAFSFIACNDEAEECETGISQEADSQKLDQLLSEILELSRSEECIDPSDWTFAPFGSKACGGPQGYVPFSNAIDRDEFLRLVAMLTTAEAEFNIDYQVISDCALVNPPSSIICRAGAPVMLLQCPSLEGDVESPCNDIPPTDEECDAAFSRWFYVRAQNACALLEYSGCELYGFESQEECDACLCAEG